MLIIAALVVGFLVGASAVMIFASLAISNTSHCHEEAVFYKKHAEDWEGLAMEYKQIASELAAKTAAANPADPETSE